MLGAFRGRVTAYATPPKAYAAFAADEDMALLEARHQARARCEDQIRCAKETGFCAFPFQGFVQNQICLELVLAPTTCSATSVASRSPAMPNAWEPRTLRYRLLDTAGRMVTRGRRVILRRVQRDWPWTELWLPPSPAFASSSRLYRELARPFDPAAGAGPATRGRRRPNQVRLELPPNLPSRLSGREY
ncbi:MAG: transposase [Candidatus Dormibacteraceae bacterium]